MTPVTLAAAGSAGTLPTSPSHVRARFLLAPQRDESGRFPAAPRLIRPSFGEDGDGLSAAAKGRSPRDGAESGRPAGLRPLPVHTSAA